MQIDEARRRLWKCFWFRLRLVRRLMSFQFWKRSGKKSAAVLAVSRIIVCFIRQFVTKIVNFCIQTSYNAPNFPLVAACALRVCLLCSKTEKRQTNQQIRRKNYAKLTHNKSPFYSKAFSVNYRNHLYRKVGSSFYTKRLFNYKFMRWFEKSVLEFRKISFNFSFDKKKI